MFPLLCKPMKYVLTPLQKSQIRSLANIAAYTQKGTPTDYRKGMVKGFINSAKHLAFSFTLANTHR